SLSHAGPSANDSASRFHYESGTVAYKAGRYADAISEFEIGYALSPRPEFLLSLAQSYRRLWRYPEAREYCDRFLAVAPSPAIAAEVTRLIGIIREEERLQELERKRDRGTSSSGEQKLAPPSHTAPTVTPTQPPPTPTQPAPPAQHAASIRTSTPTSPTIVAPAASTHKRAWVRDPLGGVLFAGGLAALAVGVSLTSIAGVEVAHSDQSLDH